jgi:prostaglandin-E synthase
MDGRSSRRHPEIVWAQRSEQVFLTVELPDAKDPKLKLEPDGKFIFSARAGSTDDLFEIELELLDKIDVEVYIVLENSVILLK